MDRAKATRVRRRGLLPLAGVLTLLCLTIVGASASAYAQICDGAWLPGDGASGIDGIVYTTLKLPDGDVIVAGSFSLVGSLAASNIARYRPSTGEWSALGAGLNGQVYALARLRNGDLIAGGSISGSGDVEAPGIARWNGSAWSTMGTGFRGNVFALTVMPNGDLVAGGSFTNSTLGAYMQKVARWNGYAWSSLSDLTLPTLSYLDGEVHSLLALPNGELIAGGAFVSSPGGSYNSIARWNGSSWSPLGSGIGAVTGNGVRALVRLSNGDVVAAGQFTSAGASSAKNVAVWNGTSWASLGAGVDGSVATLLLRANGELLAAGAFVDALNAPLALELWNDATWAPYAQGPAGAPSVFESANSAVELSADEILVAGSNATGPMRWSAASHSWTPAVTGGFSGDIGAFAILQNGDLVAAGYFETVGGVRVNRIARWNGSAWVGLGSGIDGVVNALAVLQDGQLVAAGAFTHAGGVSANNIAAWNGSSWSALGAGIGGSVNALAVMPGGDLVAGGSFTSAGSVPANSIARWNGSTWVNDYLGGVSGTVFDLEPQSRENAPQGLWVAGSFTVVGPPLGEGLAFWTGPSPTGLHWIPVVTDVDGTIVQIALLPNGDLVAGGFFAHVDGVAAKNIVRGSVVAPLQLSPPAWQAMGAGLTLNEDPLSTAAFTLAVRADGGLLVGGLFSGSAGVSSKNIVRWDGAAWKPLGPGVDSQPGMTGPVRAIHPYPDDELAVGGSFHYAGYHVSAYFARWVPAGGTDGDGDGADDVCDNCPYLSNPTQTDSGGLGSSLADGIGDVCQCGDVTGDGRVLKDDLDAIRDGLSGFSAAVAAQNRCSVSGAIDPSFAGSGLRRDCDVADASRIERAVLHLSPALGQVCEPAAP